jgi:tetratricopeptide (TPR) repeat protein
MFRSCAYAFLLLLVAMPAHALSPEGPFMGDCIEDPGLDADHIVSACGRFLTPQPLTGIEEREWGFFFRGVAYTRLGDYAKAEKDFKMAIRIDPEFATAWGGLGAMIEKAGNPGALGATLDTMVKFNREKPTILNDACWLRAKYNVELDTAMDDCNKSLAADPTSFFTLDSRCFVRFRKGEFANAIADCDAAIEQDPGSQSSFFLRGLSKIRLGHAKEGQADIDRAFALDPRIGRAYAAFGVVQ